MSELSNPDSDRAALRDQVIGLGEHSVRKSYFPQLQQQIEELKAARDSLERKADELEQMRIRAEESEANYRELFDKSSEAIIVHDLSSLKIHEVNQAFCDLYGYTHEEALQLTIRLFALESPDVDSDINRMINLAIHSGIHRFECQTVKKDGSAFWTEVAMKSTSIRGVQHILTVVRDISARKRAEEAVAEAGRQLEEKVADRTRALKQANEELAATLTNLQTTQAKLVQAEKLASLGSLVAGVSHELGTPVGNCVMLASTLDEKLHELEREVETGLRRSTFNRFIDEMSSGMGLLLRNLRRTVELVSSFKQVMVDQSSSRRHQYELQSVIMETEMVLQSEIKHAGCTFQNDIPADIVLDGYPGPLGQVITNLVSNAILHGFDGRTGGVIQVSAERDGDGHVLLVFADNGCGIPVENLPKIFDPFFTTKLGQGGSGLGLHIVYNMITGILGGTIRVESSPGNGTRFLLELPLVAAEVVVIQEGKA